MFGKNHQRYAKVLAGILGIAVIASMLLAYFSLLF